MKTVIELEGMAFHAPHGCYDLEKKVGNRYLVDLSVEVDAAEAAMLDDLTKSVSYLSLFELVRKLMAEPSNILENVAHRILTTAKTSFPGILHATTKVSKLAPPLGGQVEKVSVKMSI